jgi:hypothetical protein
VFIGDASPILEVKLLLISSFFVVREIYGRFFGLS